MTIVEHDLHTTHCILKKSISFDFQLVTNFDFMLLCLSISLEDPLLRVNIISLWMSLFADKNLPLKG